ncbi:hypothetical protein SAMN04487895_104314 [Paenibacillus sophorae]|uniref:Uncharacterized protein n=1 Tax=Paenibacillus sophorae TaxID=1333845 RepID=A0A1H8LG94_9BACL|nr:hypothetical protein [Paenibacillus sophorae]QWU17309.1 hypothetical protein KP014_09205 [Paenibacillus sophorae]SEO03768.1 hypothetical protein SAMN04487895_104314 [Paenibacillus sophorae]
MDPRYQDSSVEAEHLETHKKADSSLIASAFIEYAAYFIIFLGFLYFLVIYLFPKF